MHIANNYNKTIVIKFDAIKNDPYGRHRIASITNEVGKRITPEITPGKLAKRIDNEINEQWEGKDVTIVVNSDDLNVTVKADGREEELSKKSCLLSMFNLRPPSFDKDERLEKLDCEMKDLWKDVIKTQGKRRIERRIQKSCSIPPRLGVDKDVMNGNASARSWKVRIGLFYLLETSDLPAHWPNMTMLQKKQYLGRLLSRQVPAGEISALDKKINSGQWEFIRKGVLAHELGHMSGKSTAYESKKYRNDPQFERGYEYEADDIAASLPDVRIGKGLMTDLEIDKSCLEEEDKETDTHPSLESRIEMLQRKLARRRPKTTHL